MAAVARIGDTSSHGGLITGGAASVLANGIGVARIGDDHWCPSHGTTPIVTGSGSVRAAGALVARVGDMAGCGAVIQTGSPDVEAG